MRKYLAAAALGATLMAGQAAAYDSGVVNVGDRIASQSATAEGMEGNNDVLYFVVAAALIAGIVGWVISSGSPNANSRPASP